MGRYLIKDTEINIETLSTLDVGIVNINYPIGSAYDGIPSGTAHFLEHIICSTHNFAHGKLTAQTQRDETNYYFYVSKNNIDTIFKELSWKISINENILRQERNTIRNEIKQFNINSRNRALEYLHSLLFKGKGYGKSILGNEDQILQISKFDLEKGMELYKTPKSVNITGPWKKEYIMNCICQSDLIGKTGLHSSINNLSPITIGRGQHTLLEDTNVPFLGGAWFLNINKSAQIYIQILKCIWENRITKNYPYFTLRIHLYNYGGILTVDSTSVKADQTDIEEIIALMKLPLSIQEFKKALIKVYINYHRLSEDLQTRLNYQNNLDFQSALNKLTLEEMLEFQRNIINFISYEIGLYLLSNSKKKSNICYFPIKKSNIEVLKEKNTLNIPDDTKDKEETKKVDNSSLLLLSKKNIYYTASSSVLTKRYHVLLRVDCKEIGRLLLSNELPSELLIKGILENVRYEGWHTLYHISFFDEISMKESIKNFISYRWNYENHNSLINEERYMKNLEFEMKWRIIKAFNNPKVKNRGYLIGISIVTPEEYIINKDYFENFYSEEIQPPLSIEKGIIENKVIKARFHGAALICRLPKQTLCSLILQETAFGNNVSFPTLESLVREKGLSYRIVQSLISDENELYIFWGIQCDPNNIGLFKDIVQEWLFYLEKYSDEVEKWFNRTWVYLNPQNHNSIFQLIRDIDRMGQYTQPSFDINFNFKEFIKNIKSEKLIEITFSEGIRSVEE